MTEDDKHEAVVVTTQLTEKQFVELAFLLLFRKTSIKIVIVILLLIFFLSATLLIMDLIYPPEGGYSIDLELVVPVAMLSTLFGLTYFGAKRNYQGNQRIHEKIDYLFENDHLKVEGESFNSMLSWDKIHKVELKKKWLLIWQSSVMVNAIPRAALNPVDIDKIESVLNQNGISLN